MANRHVRERRALAKLEKRPSAGTSPSIADPIRTGLDRSIIIEMGKLQPPSNCYDADVAWVEQLAPGDTRLYFAKLNRDDQSTFRSRLEVRYPVENLVGHFWRNSRDFHGKMHEYVSKWTEAARNQGADRSKKALKEHSEWANFDSMAHAGTEAVVDFYHLPPTGIARFSRGLGSDGLTLVPIVRVQLLTFELDHLLNEVRGIVDRVSEFLPEGVPTFMPIEEGATVGEG